MTELRVTLLRREGKRGTAKSVSKSESESEFENVLHDELDQQCQLFLQHYLGTLAQFLTIEFYKIMSSVSSITWHFKEHNGQRPGYLLEKRTGNIKKSLEFGIRTMNNTAGEILCKAEMKPKTKDIEANYKLVKQIPRISNV